MLRTALQQLTRQCARMVRKMEDLLTELNFWTVLEGFVLPLEVAKDSR